MRDSRHLRHLQESQKISQKLGFPGLTHVVNGKTAPLAHLVNGKGVPEKQKKLFFCILRAKQRLRTYPMDKEVVLGYNEGTLISLRGSVSWMIRPIPNLCVTYCPPKYEARME